MNIDNSDQVPAEAKKVRTAEGWIAERVGNGGWWYVTRPDGQPIPDANLPGRDEYGWSYFGSWELPLEVIE